jgi:hypothetical protein
MPLEVEVLYAEQIVERLEKQLPWDGIDPAERRLLCCFYALLAMTSKDRIEARDVHDAWVCGMTALRRSHPSMLPYDELEVSIQARDEPFAAVINACGAAYRLGREGART